MPIRELRCPRCGDGVEMGLPRGATVISISAETDPNEGVSEGKLRTLRCRNDHDFSVVFEP